MRGREIGYRQRQGRGRGWEPAEVMVRGWGQVLFGKTHWTAAVAADLMGDKAKCKMIIYTANEYILCFIHLFSIQQECRSMIHFVKVQLTIAATICCIHVVTCFDASSVSVQLYWYV